MTKYTQLSLEEREGIFDRHRERLSMASKSRGTGLNEYIQDKLRQCWSPIAIAGRWSLEHSRQEITKEAIYAWIYGSTGKRLGLPKLLPRAKPKRGLGRPKKPRGKILDRISIYNRPEAANNRSELGHLEGDLVFNSGSQ